MSKFKTLIVWLYTSTLGNIILLLFQNFEYILKNRTTLSCCCHRNNRI